MSNSKLKMVSFLPFKQPRGNLGRGVEGGRKAYFAHRLDTVALFPFGHTTVNGLRVMRPPQEKPTHPSEVGAVIDNRVSNGALVEAVSGMATRRTGTVEVHAYWR
jgi:hypothetical protein